MAKINEAFAKLPGNYLFSEIARSVAAYSALPDAGRRSRIVYLPITIVQTGLDTCRRICYSNTD